MHYEDTPYPDTHKRARAHALHYTPTHAHAHRMCYMQEWNKNKNTRRPAHVGRAEPQHPRLPPSRRSRPATGAPPSRAVAPSGPAWPGPTRRFPVCSTTLHCRLPTRNSAPPGVLYCGSLLALPRRAAGPSRSRQPPEAAPNEPRPRAARSAKQAKTQALGQPGTRRANES